MTISIRLNEADSTLIRKYADLNGLSVSELMRQAVLEKIEDELDLKAYEAALAEYRANPVAYTLDEVEKELGLK